MSDVKNALVDARLELGLARDRLRAAIYNVKTLRENIKLDRSLTRTVREDQKKLRAEKAANTRLAAIEKIEAKLAALKAKAGSQKGLVQAAKKPGKVKVIVEGGKKKAA
ncbi:hypothetical protein UFOVP49_67 [uncultured Caudovirales phage]|uniref:50S ribosomal protein L29 n=1 Tax=uncultured Caudovirales phage TaxID=2100421 RepID=A0A6J5KQP4_9CAUD|nr:hypothetical protein UFOVP49_67 [uncultured Caudovirales phage]